MSLDYVNPQAWIGAFKTQYEGPVAGLWHQSIMKINPVTQLTVNYPGLAPIGGMAAWTSSRQLNSPSDANVQITSAIYENSVVYPVDKFNADSLGFFMAQVQDMAIDCRFHWNSLVSAAIAANGNAYDAKAFFHADHNNLVEVGCADKDAPTDIEAGDIITSSLATMLTATDAAGKAINGSMRKMSIVVGDAPKYVAFTNAIRRYVLSDRSDSPVAGFVSQGFGFDVVIEPALTGDAIYCFRGDGQVGALIGQQVGGENAIDYTVLGPDSEYAKTTNNVLFGVKAVRGIGYGRYQNALKVTLLES